MVRGWLPLAWLPLAALPVVQGMHHDGVIQAAEYAKWFPAHMDFKIPVFAHYVGKFCFDVDKEGGRVGEVSMTVKSDHGVETPGNGLMLMFFSDQQHKWQRIRHEWPATCEKLRESASFIQPVEPDYNESRGQHRFDFETVVGVKQRIRHRYWYFALVSCNVTQTPRLEYHLHTVNLNQGFQSEFGMDEEGSIALDLFTFIGFMALFCSVLGYAVKRFGHGALRTRPLLQSLLVAVALSSVGGVFMLVDSLTYAGDGIGVREAAVAGATCECLAKIQLALLQLFVSRGRDFLQSPKEFARRTIVQLSVVVFIAIAVGSEIYEQYYAHLDWSTTVYFYSSKPGFVVLMMNIALFIDVIRSTKQLFAKGDMTPQLKQFYTRTAICASLYFLALPILVGAAFRLHPWQRRKWVERIEILTRFVVCGLLAYCLWPSRLDHIIDARLNSSQSGQNENLASLNEEEMGVSLQPVSATVRENADNDAGAPMVEQS